MKNEHKVTAPIYRKIAIDIAENIATGKYAENQKLYGRSVLASQYGVSPETIRKAVYLLKDVGILETEKGSGVKIISTGRAKEFIKLQNEKDSLKSAKNDIITWAKEQYAQLDEIIGKIQFIANAAERLGNAGPFLPYEITITANSAVIGKTADELHFWHKTGATIVAIRRGENLIISPGPYAAFNETDVFYIVGDGHAYAAAIRLIYGNAPDCPERPEENGGNIAVIC